MTPDERTRLLQRRDNNCPFCRGTAGGWYKRAGEQLVRARYANTLKGFWLRCAWCSGTGVAQRTLDQAPKREGD